jgi:hypothetical protein
MPIPSPSNDPASDSWSWSRSVAATPLGCLHALLPYQLLESWSSGVWWSLIQIAKLRGRYIFTRNRKPNRTEPKFRFFGSSVRFRFLYLKSSVFGIIIGFHRIPNQNTKKPNHLTLSILKFGYSIMWTKCVKQLNCYSLIYMWCMMYL